MRGDWVSAEPGADPSGDTDVLDDLVYAGDAHDGVLAGGLDDRGTGALHAWAAPGIDRELGMSLAKLGNDDRGMVIAGRLEGGEENAPAVRIGMERLRGHS